MKYLIQMMAMLSDVLIILAVIGLLYGLIGVSNLLLWVLGALLLLTTYKIWKSQGGFIAWTKQGRKAFFKNWDEINRK